MQSIRSRIILSILRHRHLLKLKPKQTAQDWENDLPAVRTETAKAAKSLGTLPKGLTAEPVAIGDMTAEWISSGGNRDKAMLYFHGGGYVLGSVEAHRGIVAKFVKGSGVAALLFDYRLAPENPYPAALEDALAAYEWLLDRGLAHERIVFAGDSAGGGLCMATLLALKDKGRPMPAGAAVLSPWTDVACTGETLKTNAKRCLAPENSWIACRKHYAQDHDPTDPYISPLYGDLAGLPPLHITAGGHETLLSDSTRFADRAKAAGVDVTLRVGAGMCHCYPACAPMFPEAGAALRETCAFMNDKLAA